MTINRMLNALWAQISSRGFLIKIATNPYNPSPGTTVGSGSSNNQGMAAVTGPTPFVTLDPNGLCAQVPVNTPLSGIGSVQNIQALDEGSSAYQVSRHYGDIYFFNDGNIIQWGGNGKNFNFGNGYEEGHAWANQACVYNNETFTIPRGSMSLYLAGVVAQPSNYNAPASLDAYEWLGGNVEKFWGNGYEFKYGSSYEWSAGPNNYVDAYGNTDANALPDIKLGKHCTYSYGTGYEESLIAWDQGSGWFHADDPTSPYTSRKHDDWTSSFLSLESVASSFAAASPVPTFGGLLSPDQAEEATDTLSESEAALDAVFNPQDFAKRNTWKAVNLKVSKDFGNTYEYHNGPGLSVQEGPTEERNYGNTSSTVVGNSSESVTGNSTSTVTGNKMETTTGNSTEMVQGDALEQFWGGKAEFFMGGKSEMNLAACDEITLSAKVEITAGAALEIFLGFKTEIASAGSLSFELGPKLELIPDDAELKELTAKVEVIESAQAQLANVVMNVTDLYCNV